MKITMMNLSLVLLLTITLLSCINQSQDLNISSNNKPIKDSIPNDTSIFSSNMEELFIENSSKYKITAKIVFPVGKIRVKKGNTNLVSCYFKCSKNEWKPEISFKENSFSGEISIEPKKKTEDISFNDSDTCRWILEFDPKKKYNIDMQIGAGKGDLNLEGLIIEKVKLELGAGKVNVNLKNTSVPNIEMAIGAGKAIINLTGSWNNNLMAEIAGGVGEIEIHLPTDVGVKAEVNGLLGDVDANGFIKKQNTYSNNVLGKTKYTLNLKIDGAIGKVILVME